VRGQSSRYSACEWLLVRNEANCSHLQSFAGQIQYVKRGRAEFVADGDCLGENYVQSSRSGRLRALE
jgi:hypothetical protein